jgi:outer membrane protein assembly factor BamE
MQKFRLLILITVLGLSACSFPGVYRIDVQQGNIVEASSLQKLAVGMTRRQVHLVLGSPLITSTFDNSEEIYLYTIQLEGGDIHQQKVALNYQGDVLKEINYSRLLQPELANPGLIYKIREES